MPLGVISRVSFWFLRIFGEKNAKELKLKYGQNGLLRLNVGNPRRNVALRRSLGCLATARLRYQKGHPSGTPRRSIFT